MKTKDYKQTDWEIKLAPHLDKLDEVNYYKVFDFVQSLIDSERQKAVEEIINKIMKIDTKTVIIYFVIAFIFVIVTTFVSNWIIGFK